MTDECGGFSAPTFADVEQAADRIAGATHATPVMTSVTANRTTGASMFFKMENFQRGGAFKLRGAYNMIAQLQEQDRRRGVVAFSSGNHAQAVALAAKILGIPATIVMPSDAPRSKLAATQGYGATVVPYNRHSDDRMEMTAEISERTGAALIPPFDHPHIIAGQGTAALELFQVTGPLDYLFVPLGGGGLLSGCALAATGLSPHCKVVGVEPEAGNDGQRSFRTGEIVTIPVPRTIADGAQTTSIGRFNFPIIRSLVHDVLTASDDELRVQMKFFQERMKVVVEPTGCLAAAAAMRMSLRDARVGIIVSGGNVDVQNSFGAGAAKDIASIQIE